MAGGPGWVKLSGGGSGVKDADHLLRAPEFLSRNRWCGLATREGRKRKRDIRLKAPRQGAADSPHALQSVDGPERPVLDPVVHDASRERGTDDGNRGDFVEWRSVEIDRRAACGRRKLTAAGRCALLVRRRATRSGDRAPRASEARGVGRCLALPARVFPRGIAWPRRDPLPGETRLRRP